MLEGSSKQQRAALLAMSELGGDTGREVMIRFAKLNGGEGAADIFTDLASRTDDKVERNNLRKMYLEVVRDSHALAAIQIEIPTRFGKAQPRRVTVIKYRLEKRERVETVVLPF